MTARTLDAKFPEVIRRMAPLWEAKNFRVPVHQEWPLAEAAHRLVLSGKMLGKVVLSI
ncbi:MAG: zinc-binding dehydrogenase [bacterium]|nr:zinc-binding dehydrogenase [bacterium]